MAKARALPPRAWQRMLSGRRLDLIDPSPLDVEVEDIAHGLARVARWNGQTQGAHAFSVAQHSILVTRLFEAQHPEAGAVPRLYALLHDAAEYVIGDMISPFKAILGANYKNVERRLQAAIHLRFGLKAAAARAVHSAIKRADKAAAFHEAVTLAGFARAEAERFFGAHDTLPPALLPLLTPWDTGRAQNDFVKNFQDLETLLPSAEF